MVALLMPAAATAPPSFSTRLDFTWSGGLLSRRRRRSQSERVACPSPTLHLQPVRDEVTASFVSNSTVSPVVWVISLRADVHVSDLQVPGGAAVREASAKPSCTLYT